MQYYGGGQQQQGYPQQEQRGYQQGYGAPQQGYGAPPQGYGAPQGGYYVSLLLQFAKSYLTIFATAPSATSASLWRSARRVLSSTTATSTSIRPATSATEERRWWHWMHGLLCGVSTSSERMDWQVTNPFC